jgi:3-oxoacyl-[acyl-carrier protein] reductase
MGDLRSTGLEGKVALVAAASKGLGRAVAESMVRDGAQVAITARGAAALESTADAIRAEFGSDVLPIVSDVTNAEDVRRAVEATVERFGGLDILVTNAGGPRSATFDMLGEEDWYAAFELTLMSVIRFTMAAVPHLRRRGGGRIIHITSIAAKQPVAGLMLSNALRAAVAGFSKTLSNELAADRILVNCVAPGFTRTERVTGLTEATSRREGVTPEEAERRFVAQVPLKRLAEPREFGDVVAFLASDRASYVTGATIQVDGGCIQAIM